MSVTGYVGLPGSGKTLELVARALDARKKGREVYANFRIGRRRAGYLVPTCSASPVACRGPYHAGHRPTGYRFVARTTRLDRMASLYGWRSGRGFIPYRNVRVLSSWDQVVAIREVRDEFGKPHRTRLVQGEDGTWTTIRACEVWNCGGCSQGITLAIDELNLWAPSRMWQETGLGVLNRWAYNRKDGLEILWTAQHEARIDKVAREVTDFIWSCSQVGGALRLFGHDLQLRVFHRAKWIPALMSEKDRTDAKEGVKPAGRIDWQFSLFHQHIADAYDTYEHVAVNEELQASRSAKEAAKREERQRPRRVA